jgi:endonuclease IV
MRLGVHLSIAPEFAAAAQRGGEIGCRSLQIFCGNPRGWKKKPLEDYQKYEIAVTKAINAD